MNGTDRKMTWDELAAKAKALTEERDDLFRKWSASQSNREKDLETKYLKLGVSYSAMHQRAEVAEYKLEKAEAERDEAIKALSVEITARVEAETRVKELETLLKSHPHPYFAHHVAEALKEGGQ